MNESRPIIFSACTLLLSTQSKQALGQSLCFQSVTFSRIYLFSSCLSIGTPFGGHPMLLLRLAFVYERWYPSLLLYQDSVRLAL